MHTTTKVFIITTTIIISLVHLLCKMIVNIGAPQPTLDQHRNILIQTNNAITPTPHVYDIGVQMTLGGGLGHLADVYVEVGIQSVK